MEPHVRDFLRLTSAAVLQLVPSWHPRGNKGKPGQAVMGLSKEQREKLKKLKSEDLQKLRPDAIL